MNRKQKGARFQRVPMRLVAPTVVTLLALCSGLTAMRMALEERWDLAIAGILVAAVLDGLDGRIARLLKGTSRFGAELDSLADFVNFGVAPAIILYSWALDDVRSLGWIAALLYAISGALRLARFNVAMDDPDRPAWSAKFFSGIPAPAGGLVVLLPIYLDRLGMNISGFSAAIAIYCLFVGFLMVSQLPSFSGKQFGMAIRRELVLPVFVSIVAAAALLASYPYEVLSFAVTCYLISLPFAFSSFRAHLKRDKEQSEGTVECVGVD
ncbi:CDP-diacylglycerol--serine O-phosphatidyltransferase [Flexibacterium corallicola]|uniref:CDP-diacylglycerol--serine O-phosphatidyltransferase n=1 Tax=Flexibacterium corallicola TaxID=3037259 RepID=UPI00286F2418|nr:CDP-diacylglycerol--serine O-phosphatidyltransferase [Pseudovibrio sp. M1P-2-3]